MADTVTIDTICPNCKGKKKFKVSSSAYAKWKGGSFASQAFPELSRDDLERLISGYCGKCWNKLFPD